MAWIFQKIGGFFGFKQQITKDAINGIYEKTYYSNQKIKERLNFKFQPINQVIAETSEKFLQDHSS